MLDWDGLGGAHMATGAELLLVHDAVHPHTHAHSNLQQRPAQNPLLAHWRGSQSCRFPER